MGLEGNWSRPGEIRGLQGGISETDKISDVSEHDGDLYKQENLGKLTNICTEY